MRRIARHHCLRQRPVARRDRIDQPSSTGKPLSKAQDRSRERNFEQIAIANRGKADDKAASRSALNAELAHAQRQAHSGEDRVKIRPSDWLVLGIEHLDAADFFKDARRGYFKAIETRILRPNSHPRSIGELHHLPGRDLAGENFANDFFGRHGAGQIKGQGAHPGRSEKIAADKINPELEVLPRTGRDNGRTGRGRSRGRIGGRPVAPVD